MRLSEFVSLGRTMISQAYTRALRWPLYRAISRDDDAGVRRALEWGADPAWPEAGDPNFPNGAQNALQYAALHAKRRAVGELLAHGVDANEGSPLTAACMGNNTEFNTSDRMLEEIERSLIVAQLVKAGANVEGNDSFYTPLHHSIANNHHLATGRLLQHGATGKAYEPIVLKENNKHLEGTLRERGATVIKRY